MRLFGFSQDVNILEGIVLAKLEGVNFEQIVLLVTDFYQTCEGLEVLFYKSVLDWLVHF
jgi:hypothetical protein